MQGTYLAGMVLVEGTQHPLRVVEGTTRHRSVVTAVDNSVRDLKHAKHKDWKTQPQTQVLVRLTLNRIASGLDWIMKSTIFYLNSPGFRPIL